MKTRCTAITSALIAAFIGSPAISQENIELLPDGSQIDKQAQQGYELRQPLNSGVNTIHYLSYFEQLREKYLKSGSKQKKINVNTSDVSGSALSRFFHFYRNRISKNFYFSNILK